MKKYKCEKHGFLFAHERLTWSKSGMGRWCIHCCNEMMDNYCGKLTEYEDGEPEKEKE